MVAFIRTDLNVIHNRNDEPQVIETTDEHNLPAPISYFDRQTHTHRRIIQYQPLQ